MRKKIYVRIFGGLGNQLFIYSCAKSLALQKEACLVLDSKSGFLKDVYQRSYKLDCFDIDDRRSGWAIFLYIFFRKRVPAISKILKPGILFLRETDSRAFEKNVLNNSISDFLYLEGYWQSYRYFEKHESLIRQRLRITKKMSTRNVALAIALKQKNSVAIHLRRIDYHPVLDFSYYENAIKHIVRHVQDPELYIFSDDMAFCKSRFWYNLPVTFIDHNEHDEVADFYLMMHCHHFIIANSSFSWWAAWLGENSDKKVVAPAAVHIGVKDYFYPSSWITI